MVARSLGAVGFGYFDGTPSSFMRKGEHLADGRDLISINISGGGRFQVEGVKGLDRYCGGAVVLESRRESALHSLDDSTAWTICMERAPLEPLLAGVDGRSSAASRRDNPGSACWRVISASLFRLAKEADLDARDAARPRPRAVCARRARRHAGVGARARRAGGAPERGADQNRQASLSGASTRLPLRHELGLSVRYLHKLLEPTGRISPSTC